MFVEVNERIKKCREMGDAEPANQENREVRKELPEKTLQKDI
jgi:hypothetical protein